MGWVPGGRMKWLVLPGTSVVLEGVNVVLAGTTLVPSAWLLGRLLSRSPIPRLRLGSPRT